MPTNTPRFIKRELDSYLVASQCLAASRKIYRLLIDKIREMSYGHQLLSITVIVIHWTSETRMV